MFVSRKQPAHHRVYENAVRDTDSAAGALRIPKSETYGL